jgi:hypothetical protein
MSRRPMFAYRIAQKFQIEFAVPIREHGRVVVCPSEAVSQLRMRSIRAYDFMVFDANRRPEPAIMPVQVDIDSADVPDRFVAAAGLGEGQGKGIQDQSN